MMLGNVGYAASLTWAKNVLARLEAQALVPMFGETPVSAKTSSRCFER